VAIAKDGVLMASVSDDQSVITWNVGKDVPVLRFFAHDNVIETLLFIEGDASVKLMNA